MREVNDEKGIARGQIYLAETYQDQSLDSLAISYYSSGLEMYQSAKDYYREADALGNLSMAYLRQKNIEKAILYGNKSLEISQEKGFSRVSKDVSEVLFQAYKTRDHYEKALEMHELHLKMRDTIMSEENQRGGLQARV